MGSRQFDPLSAVAALQEGPRRQIYTFVRQQRHPVTREEVAGGVGMSRRLAAFHLDKLVERGVLQADYRRPPGRGGPGAGRPAKRYRPAEREITVSFPERHYELVGQVLAAAIEGQSEDEGARDAAFRVARSQGFEIGRELASKGDSGPEAGDALTVAEWGLGRCGYEPFRRSPREVALGNCPFRALAQESPDLVCAVNRSFLDGLLRGLGADSVQVVPEGQPAECCATLRVVF
jgi:predicted ArsR family transcriptional regulator